MTTQTKRHRITNLKLREISTVDRPAQTGAVVVLMKSDTSPEDVAIRKNAAAVVGGATPAYGVADYEDAMFTRAAELAQGYGSTPEQALVKGLVSDTTLRDLTHACEIARCSAYATEVRKRHVPAAA